MGLFGEAQHPVVEALADLDLEALTPDQALTELQRLRKWID
jgi:hypothetical protein